MLKNSYACGAAVVARTLKNVNTRYPVWCMVSDGVSDDCVDFLRGQFDNVVRVPLISHRVCDMKTKKQKNIYGSWIQHSFTKWNIMNQNLFPVDRVILVDADMMFLRNCDELFDLAPPAATFSSPWASTYPQKSSFKGVFDPYGPLQHGQTVSPQRIRRGFSRGIVGLACMVLVRPSEAAWKTLHAILDRDAVYGYQTCVSGFDEQALAEVWLAMGEPIHHIHQRYNWIVGKTNWLKPHESPRSQQFYNAKPWQEDKDTTAWQDVKDWYVIWDQITDDDPSCGRWLNAN
jgi:hypothetical protein